MQRIEVTAKDGATISAVEVGYEDSNKKAVVIISHGFGEHAVSYSEFAEDLRKAGYASVALDQRGHGTPPEGIEKWHGIIPDYQCFIDDIISITEDVRRKNPETPIALFGHSMGGNIVMNTLLRSSPEPSSSYICAILEAPWFGLNDPPSLLMVSTAKILSKVLPNIRHKREMQHDNLSSLPERRGLYSKDPLYHGYISMRMLTGILEACKFAMVNASKLSIPTYLAYADNELVVCNKAILEFAEKAGDIVTLKEYTSNHAIHNDSIRDSYISDIVSYLDSKIQSV
jgi:lysophospholipase